MRRAFGVWAATLFAITCLAVLYLNITNVNPDTGFSPAIVIMAYSPSLAAVMVAGLVPGSLSASALFRQVLVWKVPIKWYALALAGPALLVLVATLIYAFTGGRSSEWLRVPAPETMLAMLGPLLAGSVGEEFGWRGFGQRLLQKRYSVLLTSLAIGFLWATWHSWPILAPGGEVYAEPLPIAEGYIRLIATSIIYGWMFARTGSLLVVMLAHAGHSLAISLVPPSLFADTPFPLVIAGLYSIAAATLVVARPDLHKKRA